MRNVWFVFFYLDIDKYGHAGIWFLTNMICLLFKWTIIIEIRQNLH